MILNFNHMPKLIIRERFDGGLKNALYSNFSRYTEAILELVDNSVSHRIEGEKFTVEILASKKDITILDMGGGGMDVKGLKEFLEWGKIKPREYQDIGAYSQGGKAAIGYLGRSMVLITSPKGKKVQYRIEDKDIHEYKLKEFEVNRMECDILEGRTKIEISGLKRNIKDDELKIVLSDTYRPLIEGGQIKIIYNGEILKPIKFPLDDSFPIEPFSLPPVKNGKSKITGWIGRLAPKKMGFRGGMRCYKKGRLICDREFFSRYDAHYKGTLNFLFGEVYIDDAIANTNKTDFDRDSVEWEEAKEKIFKVLKPHIDDLLGRDIKEPTDEEKQRVKNMKQLVAELMKQRNKDLKGGLIEDEEFGQKKPEHKDMEKEFSRLAIRGSKNSYSPKTPPPNNAMGKRRRLREFMDWDIRPMDELVRSIIENDEKGKVLVINNLFPGYKEAKGNNLYLLETAAIQLAMPKEDEKITPQDYLTEFDDLFGYFCSNLELVKEKLKQREIKKTSEGVLA